MTQWHIETKHLTRRTFDIWLYFYKACKQHSQLTPRTLQGYSYWFSALVCYSLYPYNQKTLWPDKLDNLLISIYQNYKLQYFSYFNILLTSRYPFFVKKINKISRMKTLIHKPKSWMCYYFLHLNLIIWKAIQYKRNTVWMKGWGWPPRMLFWGLWTTHINSF